MANDIIFYRNIFPNWVVAGTTSKHFGDIKNPENQKKLVEALNISTNSLYCLEQ